MTRSITLSARLDIPACTELLTELTSLRGQPLTLDASAVRHIGAIGVQLLLAARASWGDPDLLRVTGLGAEARDCLEVLGFDPERIGAVMEDRMP